MTLLQNTLHCFKNALHFSGRAPKRDFWQFIWFIVLGMVICIIVNSMINGPIVTTTYALGPDGQPAGNPLKTTTHYNSGLFGNIFGLACLLPWLAVSWRRLHDIGKPGYFGFLPWLAWIALIFAVTVAHTGLTEFMTQMSETGRVNVPTTVPVGLTVFFSFFGLVGLVIYWLTRPSQPGPNKYGPNPHEVPS
ncbi:Inner membrane protein YhaH [Shimia sp. SK013]|uniref:DUF805 domain-containing protein n=1 Tax=Shimia sp. SK013 TaxID=1389006 RepID=UPI0006B48CE3|nr:DUF805 domain-containing protein [Shimia sp. SK013]KPA21659.1 Inner membrane protein YhaH [Shimia sp. SK013]